MVNLATFLITFTKQHKATERQLKGNRIRNEFETEVEQNTFYKV